MAMPVVTPARLASVLAAITQLWTAPAKIGDELISGVEQFLLVNKALFK